MEIVPALDLLDGRIVRLKKGDFNEPLFYDFDPLTLAQSFEKEGCRRLHIVDLDGAKSSIPSIVHAKILERIAGHTNLLIDYSGGIRDEASADTIFSAGADAVVIGSLAITNPSKVEKIAEKVGFSKVILAADCRENEIFIQGWKQPTSILVPALIETWTERGAEKFLITDIEKDGLLQGPAHGLYKKILEQFPKIFLIASGGVTSTDDIKILRGLGLSEAIVGKALLEKRIPASNLFSSTRLVSGVRDGN